MFIIHFLIGLLVNVNAIKEPTLLDTELNRLKESVPFPDVSIDSWTLCGTFVLDGEEDNQNLRIIIVTGAVIIPYLP